METSPENNPYAAPAAAITTRQVLPRLATRARVARLFLLLLVPFLAVDVVIRILWLTGVTDFGQVGSASVKSLAWSVFSAANGWLGVVAALAFLIWFHYAYVRARSGVPYARFTPGFAVVSWFIPLVNFVVPFLATRHLWRLSRGGAEWRAEKIPGYILNWWCLWMLSHLVAFASLIAQAIAHWPRFGSVEGLSSPRFTLGIMLSSILSLCALPLAMRLVRDVTSMQRERLGVD